MEAKLFIFLASLMSVFCSVTASAVTNLTTDHFDEFISSHAVVMVEFYAPWCGTCQELEPIYEETAKKLDPTKDVKFARVNCIEEAVLCQRYKTPIYPTLRLFQGIQDQTLYNGARVASDMIWFAERRSEPTVKILDKDKIEDFKAREALVAIGFWDAQDTKSAEIFATVADDHIDYYLFGATTDPSAALALGVSQPGIIFYNQHDHEEIVGDLEFEEDAITDFINLASIPLIGEYSRKWSWQYFGKDNLPFVGIFVNGSGQHLDLANEIRPIAKEYLDTARFAFVDTASHSRMVSTFKLEDQQLPVLVIRDGQGQIFHFPKDLEPTMHHIRTWMEAFKSNSLKQHVQTQATSATQSNLVVEVDSTNFNEIVLNSDTDVVLEFYAPWCGHCKRLTPVYEDLAALYAEYDPEIRIAKIDATANKIPGHLVQSYPTIQIFPARRKDAPITYQGNRTLEDMGQFIQKNSKNMVDVFGTIRERDTTPGRDSQRTSSSDSTAETVKAVTEAVRDEL